MYEALDEQLVAAAQAVAACVTGEGSGCAPPVWLLGAQPARGSCRTWHAAGRTSSPCTRGRCHRCKNRSGERHLKTLCQRGRGGKGLVR